MNINKLTVSFLILFFLLINKNVFSQHNLEGKWQGNLTVNGVNLRIIFNIQSEDGFLSATMDSPDQGAKGIPTDTVILIDNKLRIEVKKISGFYEGILSSDSLISGSWNQAGSKYYLDLNKISEEEKEIEYSSLWEGILDTPTIDLRLTLKIYTNEDGSIGAFVDSPDQGVKDLPVSEISFRKDSLFFTVNVVSGTYEGEVKDSLTIEGNWTQAGSTFPLNFKRVDHITEISRPQVPEEPYPYKVEDVKFRNEKDNVTLAGTLTLPESGDSFTGVILISGSGPQDRDETLFNHKPFLILSDYLTRSGLAVLRFDDRGTGSSTGNFNSAVTEDFANDVLAAVDFLKKRKEIKSIGLIGHSEGGLIAPIVSVKSDNVDFIVLLAGPGLPGEQILLSQTELIFQAEKLDEDEINKILEINSRIYKAVKEIQDSTKLERKLREIFNENLSSLSKEEKQKLNLSDETIEQQIKVIISPWFRNFVKYDPRPVLKKVKVPVLAITGGKDLQVPPDENLEAIGKALNEGKNNNFKIMKLEGLNHLFQTAETGSPSEYGKIEETFSPKALKVINDWISNLNPD